MKDGAGCNATFREVDWTEEVLVRGKHSKELTGSAVPRAPELLSGAVRAADPPDKAYDLLDENGQARSR